MYQILQDADGGLMLMIEPQKLCSNDPLFIYDGGDTAILFRDWDSCLRLNHLSDEVRPLLLSAKEIYVFEVRGEDVICDYYAPIRIVRDVKSLIA